MSNNKLINDEVEKTMESLNHIEKNEVSPFFFSKLQGRLKSEASASVMDNTTLVRTFSPVVIGLMLLLLVNTYTILSIQLPTVDRVSEIDTFLKDYEIFIDDEAIIQWLEE